MYKPFITTLLAAALLCLTASQSRAALSGTSVTGSLQFAGDSSNYFDPSFLFVPAGDLNNAGTTVTISNSAIEFGYDDYSNLDQANFTNTQLIVSDLVEQSGPGQPFSMMFTDTAFTGATISKVTDTFPLTFSLRGDVLTVNSPGGNMTAGNSFSATFNIATPAAPVPEPSGFAALFLAGLAAVALRKRLRSAV